MSAGDPVLTFVISVLLVQQGTGVLEGILQEGDVYPVCMSSNRFVHRIV